MGLFPERRKRGLLLDMNGMLNMEKEGTQMLLSSIFSFAYFQDQKEIQL